MRSSWSPASYSRAVPTARVLVALLAALVLVLAAASIARAEGNVIRNVSSKTVVVRTPSAPRGVQAKTGIVLDAETGRQLWARGVNKRRLIASTTKIMTALVSISRTTPNEMLTATNYRAGIGESLLGLKPGERMSAQDLIKGLLLESGNDAADTLAAGTASSRAAFVAAMNRRARSLGLTRTHFTNPIGLDAVRNYSTASDLAKLGRYALTVPRFSNVVDKAHLTLRSGATTRRITNRNPLIGKYPWAVGVKTGHTLAALYLLVGAAAKLDARVVSVVTGEPTEGARENDSVALLRYGRAFYRPVQPLKKQQAVYALPVQYQDDIKAKVYPRRDLAFAARNGEKVVIRLDAPKEIKGPRSKGSIVGAAQVLRNGKEVASVPVALGAAVPAPPITAVMLHALGTILPWLLLALGLAMIATAFLRRKKERTHRPGFVG
jgi:D-alanyl-D-alanine carboxypeptidase (penicillin-binding protein 5/6)